jgi:hypothetical protein
MTTTVSRIAGAPAATAAGSRANALAERLEEGARALAAFAGTLTDAQWQTRIPGDGRKVGVVVHHVAAMYPVEIQLAQVLAKGQPVTGVTWAGVHDMNASHARENDGVTREAALDLLRRNSADAARAIRALSAEDLDRAAACRSKPMRRSRASTCWSITPSGTAFITWRKSAPPCNRP